MDFSPFANLTMIGGSNLLSKLIEIARQELSVLLFHCRKQNLMIHFLQHNLF